MAEWVLDIHHRHLFRAQPATERTITVYDTAESSLVPMMRDLLTTFPAVKLASLPSTTNRGEVELAVRGASGDVDAACDWLVTRLDAFGVRYQSGP